MLGSSLMRFEVVYRVQFGMMAINEFVFGWRNGNKCGSTQCGGFLRIVNFETVPFVFISSRHQTADSSDILGFK